MATPRRAMPPNDGDPRPPRPQQPPPPPSLDEPTMMSRRRNDWDFDEQPTSIMRREFDEQPTQIMRREFDEHPTSIVHRDTGDRYPDRRPVSGPRGPVLPSRAPSTGPLGQMSAARRSSDQELPRDFVSSMARRSATSPSMWDDWDESERPLLPTHQHSAARPTPWQSGPHSQGSATQQYPRSQASAARPYVDPKNPRQERTLQDRLQTTQELARPTGAFRGRPLPHETDHAADDTAANSAEKPTRRPPSARKTRRFIWVIVGLIVLAMIIGGLYILPKLKRTGPAVLHEQGDAELLIKPEELADITPGWSLSDAAMAVTDKAPTAMCLTEIDTRNNQPADKAVIRTLASGNGKNSVLNRLDTYTDLQTAKAAYQTRLQLMGSCENSGQPLIVGAFALPGLGDQSMLMRVQSQESPDTYHTLILTQLGLGVIIFDFKSAGEETDRNKVIDAMRKLVKRDAELLKGANNVGAVPAEIVPPAGKVPGFLSSADVPRIQAGVGHWTPNSVQAVVSTPGTKCEGIDLAKPPGVDKMAQRTLLLTSDPAAPKTYGIDQVIYTLADPGAAEKLSASIAANISKCTEKMSTAAITRQSTFPGKGANNEAFTGTVFSVTQQNKGETVPYRVAVMNVGPKVVYLLLTPTVQYNMNEEQWTATAKRAGERASQLPS